MVDARKTAIITGASRGIGAGLVEAFLKRGYNVVGNSRQITKANPFAASASLALVDGDIGDRSTAAKIVDTAGARRRAWRRSMASLSPSSIWDRLTKLRGSSGSEWPSPLRETSATSQKWLMVLPSCCRTFSEKTDILTRLVYGVASLPLGVPVELELIVEVSA
jgi:NAD(P)-dependent dehydrogenase (short-subunit alcohol dehydrogenase family)